MPAISSTARTATRNPAPGSIHIAKAWARVSGARMHYLRAGSGSPVVLIHGLTGSCRNWHKNITTLSQHHEVFALDLLNMGQSDRVDNLDASLAATADRLADFLDALDIPQADLIAHSHGGAVSLMFAARHPSRVRSLALFAPANPFSDSSDGMVRLYSSPAGQQLAQWGVSLPRQLQMVLLGRMYGMPSRITEGCLEGYVEGLRVPGTVAHGVAIVRRWHADMAALRQALPRLASVPTLLVWGDRDRAVSLDSGRRLHQQLPLSELRILPTAGHIPFEELPEDANRLLTHWLSRQSTVETSDMNDLDDIQPFATPGIFAPTLQPQASL